MISDNIEQKTPNDFVFSCFLRNSPKLLPLLNDLPASEVFKDLPKEDVELLRHCLYSYEIILITMINHKKVEFFSLTYAIKPYYILEARFLNAITFNKNYREEQRKELIMTVNLPASLFPSHEVNICHIVDKDLSKLENEIEKWTSLNTRPTTNLS